MIKTKEEKPRRLRNVRGRCMNPYVLEDSKKGAKQMQNRHLTEILAYMQNVLVPASN